MRQLHHDGAMVLVDALVNANGQDVGKALSVAAESMLNAAMNDPEALSRLSGFLETLALAAGKLPALANITFDADANILNITKKEQP